ncbi:glycoside hydrolase family protein [Ancylobacter defluvii]|uniref:Lysozyme n=1 Tax=Ancylobacter defluvii TaxID=1282440 RepID=A0A9W6NCJ4_9HYPH|nr:peptidoglycan-binding protein [Ancylobacter defluvii]MBS7586424.1 glycoside hydrolase family protein [Ancylobacter defluvii]GLK85705.1 hypothetical protein GCM10017653_37750 [Ancylobacter defluvii]
MTVTEIQKLLAAHGWLSGPVDGVFGPKTKADVIAFQKANRLVADGIVGPKTEAALKAAPNPAPAAAPSRLRTAAGVLTAVGVLAVGLVGGWEGLKLASYRDIVGVWTVCYGETRGVTSGMRFTKEQCDAKLVDGLEEFETGMRACLNNPDAIPAKPYVAFLSLAYNVGVGTFCKSSIATKANRGDLLGACKAIPLYNKAGGKIVQGLVNRRADEQALCLSGIN